ncbi:MAG: hypothetical protein Q8O32_00900 [bacterium]|nr:hypothetical protein [bacterium]
MNSQTILFLMLGTVVLIAFSIFSYLSIKHISINKGYYGNEVNKQIKQGLMYGSLIVLAILLYFIGMSTINYFREKDTDQQRGNNSQIEASHTYYKFRFPFALDEQQISNSLMKKELIKISSIQLLWPDSIEKMAKQDGWTKINESNLNDGGSSFVSYFMDKDNPAVNLFYNWDISKGNFEYISIQFIHPAYIGSWLLDIRSNRSIRGESLNIEELMDCDGIIAKTTGDSTECIKK